MPDRVLRKAISRDKGGRLLKNGGKSTRKSHRRRLLGSVYLLAMTYKKNEYFMFFVVDTLNDSVISDPHFSFSLEGFLKRITKSIRVA